MPAQTQLVHLRDYSLEELETFFIELGEKPFRARQVFQWMWDKKATEFSQMTNISKTLSARLEEIATLNRTRIVYTSRSSATETRKLLVQMMDGKTVETVLIPEESRVTVCLSSQVGCALDCDFCATGKMGLLRNLTAGEIADQLRHAMAISPRPITNIVFMGMGEPFHNYREVLKAAHIINGELGFGIGARKITISTSGLVPQIKRFADENQRFKLAVSLNATLDQQRDMLMPINRKWNIRELVDACRYYVEKTTNMMTFEYVLLNGINDTPADARRLLRIAQQVLCKVNVIPYNDIKGRYQRPPDQTIEAFLKELSTGKFPVTVRWSRGDDIDAACGQLATTTDELDLTLYTPNLTKHE
ncbi:MAG: 23S rRNA (adenine(2503)-C(2))-methyltransferase RlmN [Lentisphaeria bacterium]|nr:23S rRNA (adenine(2503)-C(2))-methyltransferase RlmN [Candidatus Neomarinimicrobiota bacterium]MCF7842340.1 23S rRNA (adenine(2503)-C(2))-methyltransferase RlmN [Lentisphaeria bacterium]